MSSKVRIPESWIKASPNTKKIPHLYNIGQAAGIDCPNKPDDVMLIQFMLLQWEYTPYAGLTADGRATGNSVFGDVPVTGKWDMPTLGFLLAFQLKNSVSLSVDGRMDPIDLKLPPSARVGALLHLNVTLHDLVPQVFRDLSAAPGVPARLVQTVKEFS